MEFRAKIECRSCKGTGLYVGMGERDGAAVECWKCDGTGCEEFSLQYEPFEKRHRQEGVVRVYRTNPGICIGDDGAAVRLEDFGGMPLEEWLAGKPWAPGTEDRRHTCPCWFYQSADYKKKPQWDNCNRNVGGCFSACSYFSERAACWAKWDREYGEGGA